MIVGSALEGQLSLSVPTMSRWWVWRSSNAVVILASSNTRIVWRGDSHYGRVEAIESAEDDGVDYFRPKREVERVEELVEQLKARKRDEALENRRIYRPWGFYETAAFGARYQVKRICVNSGGRLSL